MNPVAKTSEPKAEKPVPVNTPNILFEIEQIQKSYNDEFELSIESICISKGSVLGLLGPTGSGKTTLLRCIAGLEELQSGKIVLDGTLHHDAIQSNNKRIAMVHQNVILIRGTVEQNIGYALHLRNDPEVNSKTNEIIDRFELKKFTQHSAQNLSKGQKTLVGLARAFVLKPEVLLLDEPTSSLDPARVQLIENEIRKLQDECNTTVIIATHNLFQAKRIANQTALIMDGKLVETADTEQFFNSPTNQTTQDFLEGKIVF